MFILICLRHVRAEHGYCLRHIRADASTKPGTSIKVQRRLMFGPHSCRLSGNPRSEHCLNLSNCADLTA